MIEAQQFYRDVLVRLSEAEVPYLVGGAYAMGAYAGIVRDTKDLDLFLRRGDLQRALDTLSQAGYRTDVPHPHFLGKVHAGDRFVDLIFGSGNGTTPVDDDWFRYARDGEVYGHPVRFCPLEEMIWSKSFIMERERYDGQDVAHAIHGAGDRIDWDRLLARFGENWRVLLAHLVLFGFIYPGDRQRVPERITTLLAARLGDPAFDPGIPGLCRGTVLSRAQFLIDITERGYLDARVEPFGAMTPDDIAQWTAAIADEDQHPLLPQ
jgi:hypothetical protein